MRKQNVKILNADGTHQRWVCFNEADRLEHEGKATRTSPLKAKSMVYTMRAVAKSSKSHPTKPNLTRADMNLLVTLNAQAMKKLAMRPHELMEPEKEYMLIGIQRLMGHNLLPFVPALANLGPAVGPDPAMF